MRGLLADIDKAVAAVQWSRPQPAAGRLRQLIETLQDFDLTSHRPKGVALVAALRGRSAEADRLLDSLADDRAHDDASLSEALRLLEAACRGDAQAGAECANLLRRHRAGMLYHLEREDTLLCAHTEDLLTEEEWSRVVSSISTALYEPQQGVAARSGRGGG